MHFKSFFALDNLLLCRKIGFFSPYLLYMSKCLYFSLSCPIARAWQTDCQKICMNILLLYPFITKCWLWNSLGNLGVMNMEYCLSIFFLLCIDIIQRKVLYFIINTILCRFKAALSKLNLCPNWDQNGTMDKLLVTNVIIIHVGIKLYGLANYYPFTPPAGYGTKFAAFSIILPLTILRLLPFILRTNFWARSKSLGLPILSFPQCKKMLLTLDRIDRGFCHTEVF